MRDLLAGGGASWSRSVAALFGRSAVGDAVRPGTVVELRGVIFQSDAASAIGDWVIRPFSKLDRRVAGIEPSDPDAPRLAMHAGLHVVLEGRDGRGEVVVEQLVGTRYETLRNGLNWTPLAEFAERDRGGWHVTVPATAFRAVDEVAVREAVDRLNRIDGRPFIGENCITFIERMFGGRRLFADSPLLQALGLAIPVADPALPLLRRDTRLDARAEELLRADSLRGLPDAVRQPAESGAGRRVGVRLLALLVVLAGIGLGDRLARR